MVDSLEIQLEEAHRLLAGRDSVADLPPRGILDHPPDHECVSGFRASFCFGFLPENLF
jgi:hypothetical protein